MKIFHGSSQIIEKPVTGYSRANLDFGQGFYLTSYQEQAERWARRKALRASGSAIINIYELTEDYDEFRLLEFEEDDKEWVDFVCACRRGQDDYKQYDLIIGSVANDKVYAAVDMYYKGLWDIERTLAALRFYEMNDQICIINQQIIDEKLIFTGSYEVSV
jgi:hypothetical protein